MHYGTLRGSSKQCMPFLRDMHQERSIRGGVNRSFRKAAILVYLKIGILLSSTLTILKLLDVITKPPRALTREL